VAVLAARVSLPSRGLRIGTCQNTGVQLQQWVNRSQPQTLYVATILFYVSAAFSVVYGQVFTTTGLVFTALEVAAGLGIANERKWGYALGIGVTGIVLLFFALALAQKPSMLFSLQLWLAAVLPVARFALLVHPQSREYQRIWFE
jgi:hypothetical protein